MRIFRSVRKPYVMPGLKNVLTGTFELRVDRLVGWVSDGHGTELASIDIDVMFQGNRLTTVPATRQPGAGRFVFTIPIDGRFTGEHLVKEQVSLTARDNAGNSGQIRLDGASQLELIRDYLGAPCKVILDLDFSDGGNARPYLGSGWSSTEPVFTWTEDNDSFITFDRPKEPGKYALRMTAGSLVDKPAVPSQGLALFINGDQLTQTFYTEAHVQFHEFTFDHGQFGSQSHTTLRLHHPDAARPCDISSSQDTRRLAFYFKRLSLARFCPLDLN